MHGDTGNGVRELALVPGGERRGKKKLRGCLLSLNEPLNGSELLLVQIVCEVCL